MNNFEVIKQHELEELNGGGLLSGIGGAIIGGTTGFISGTGAIILSHATGDSMSSKESWDVLKAGTIGGATLGGTIGLLAGPV
jgi:hypothetical protein